MNTESFANEWIAAWNTRNLERILAHYSENIVFESPFIGEFLPQNASGKLVGKPALREYWNLALARFPDLQFDLLEVFEGTSSICFNYRSVRNISAVEWMRVNEDWIITQASAHYAKTH